MQSIILEKIALNHKYGEQGTYKTILNLALVNSLVHITKLDISIIETKQHNCSNILLLLNNQLIIMLL